MKWKVGGQKEPKACKPGNCLRNEFWISAFYGYMKLKTSHSKARCGNSRLSIPNSKNNTACSGGNPPGLLSLDMGTGISVFSTEFQVKKALTIVFFSWFSLPVE